MMKMMRPSTELPCRLNSLDLWKVKNEILQEVVFGDGNLKLTKARLAANRTLPPGSIGNLAWEENQEGAAKIGAKLKDLAPTKKLLHCDVIVPKSHRLPEIRARVSGEVLVSSDGTSLVAFRTGKFGKGPNAKPKHFLKPMMESLFLALEEEFAKPFPTRLIDDDTDEVPRILGQESVQSKDLINALISGFVEGQSRPLCFAPQTSDALSKNLTSNEELDLATALQRAKEGKCGKWYGEDFLTGAREGGEASAQMAWRDLDPFEEAEEWKRWAESISLPLRTWGKF